MELMRLQTKRRAVLKRIKVFVFIFFVDQIGVHATALVYQFHGDHKYFNITLAAQFFFMMFYCFAWVFALRYYSSILFKQMDELLNSLRDSKNMSAPQRATGGGGEESLPSSSSSLPNDKIALHRKKLGS